MGPLNRQKKMDGCFFLHVHAQTHTHTHVHSHKRQNTGCCKTHPSALCVHSLVFPDRTFYLCAKTGVEADEWIKMLRWKLVSLSKLDVLHEGMFLSSTKIIKIKHFLKMGYCSRRFNMLREH